MPPPKEIFKIDGKTVSSDDFMKLKQTLSIADEEVIKLIMDKGDIYVYEATEKTTNKKFTYEEHQLGDEFIREIKRTPPMTSP